MVAELFEARHGCRDARAASTRAESGKPVHDASLVINLLRGMPQSLILDQSHFKPKTISYVTVRCS